jgi:hypothetical protein
MLSFLKGTLQLVDTNCNSCIYTREFALCAHDG